MIGKLTNEQIEEVLKENVSGHLGCNDGFNTFVYPINYLYDGKFILCHSQMGTKIKIMQQNKRVCLQVEEVNDFCNWKSVMIQGEYQELEDEWKRYYAIKSFVDQNLFLKISGTAFLHGTTEQREHPHSEGNGRSAIYRIVIDEKKGRYENELHK